MGTLDMGWEHWIEHGLGGMLYGTVYGGQAAARYWHYVISSLKIACFRSQPVHLGFKIELLRKGGRNSTRKKTFFARACLAFNSSGYALGLDPTSRYHKKEFFSGLSKTGRDGLMGCFRLKSKTGTLAAPKIVPQSWLKGRSALFWNSRLP